MLGFNVSMKLITITNTYEAFEAGILKNIGIVKICIAIASIINVASNMFINLLEIDSVGCRINLELMTHDLHILNPVKFGIQIDKGKKIFIKIETKVHRQVIVFGAQHLKG